MLIREVKKCELPDLLALYRHLNPDDPLLELGQRLEALWQEILADPEQHCLVVEVDGAIVASCVLVIIKNLTRGAKPYGLIENVVTHEGHRGRGYGTSLLHKARDIAQSLGCYKLMLLTSRGDAVSGFYERAGFQRGQKTGFIIRFA